MFSWLWNRYRLRINYNSGIQEEFWVDGYHIKTNANGDTLKSIDISLIRATDNRPIAWNIGAVESVWLAETQRGILGNKNAK